MASYDDELTTRLIWEIVYTVLEVVWVIPILALWIVSLCITGRRRKDLATRQGNVLLNIAFPIWFLSILLCSVAGGLYIEWIVDTKTDRGTIADIYSLSTSLNHLFQIGWYFGWLASSLLLLSMVEFANCFLVATGRARPKMLPTILLFAALGWFVVVFAIATAEMGEFESFYTAYLNVVNPTADSSYAEEVAASINFDNAQIVVNKLDAAYCFLATIFTVAFTGLAAAIVHFTRTDTRVPPPAPQGVAPPYNRDSPSLGYPAVLLLVASLFLLLRFLYGAVIDVAYLIPIDVTVPLYLEATTPVLSDWTMSIALVLVFNVANYPLFLANPNRRAQWVAGVMNHAQMTAAKQAAPVVDMGGGVQPVYGNPAPQVAYVPNPGYQNGAGYQNAAGYQNNQTTYS